MMVLELESLEELFKMFKDKEQEMVVAVGQVNTVNNETDIISMTAFVTLKFTGYSDETLIRYTKKIGETVIPGGISDSPEYATIKAKIDADFEKLKTETQTIKDTWLTQLQSKGFQVVKGLWTA